MPTLSWLTREVQGDNLDALKALLNKLRFAGNGRTSVGIQDAAGRDLSRQLAEKIRK